MPISPNSKKNLKMWGPGQSGNPRGGQAHDPALKAVKTLTKKELVDVGNLIVKNSYDQILLLAAKPNATALQRMVAAVVVRIVTNGDMSALDVLLNRLVGKVKDEILHQGDLVSAPQIIVTLPDNGRSARVIDIEKLEQIGAPAEDDDFGF